jgi:DNA-binding NtrC family response regulator
MKKKVLFVDDEPDMTRMLKIALEGIGLTIDTFNSMILCRHSKALSQTCMDWKERQGLEGIIKSY